MMNIAAIFPGSDSQFVGMYKSLYDEYDIARRTIDEAEQVTGANLRELCFKGPLSVLGRSENSYAAIVAFGVAAFRVFTSETGLTPQFCAGHSLGEYTALACAGALSFSDTLELVRARDKISREVRKATDGGMSIIDNIDSSVVERICKEQRKLGREVYVSCYNSPTQTAVSGRQDDIEETEKIIHKESGKVSPLYNSAPFHCPLMECGIEKLKDRLNDLNLGEFRYPVVSNYTGKPFGRISELKECLIKQLTNPVRWVDTINYLVSKNVQCVIDFSARNMFENIIKMKQSLKIVCFGIGEERKSFIASLQGGAYKDGRTSFISKSIIAAVATPNLNINQNQYKSGVIDNYQKLIEIRAGLEKGSIDYSQELKRQIILLLKNIFSTKRLDKKEQDRWLRQILDETASTYLKLDANQ